MTRHRKRSGFKPRSLYVWHRYLGVSAALLVVVLAVTGIFLNHTEDMNLDARYVRSTALLDWYGIKAQQPISYRAGAKWLSLSDGQIYLDEAATEIHGKELNGVVTDAHVIGVLLDNALVLLTQRGQLIERLDQVAGLPAQMIQIGMTEQGRWAVQGNQTVMVADAELMHWREMEDAVTVDWSESEPAPASLIQQLGAHARYQSLTWERVLLDLHSGRLFGNAGVWVMDAAAVVMLLLAGSGTWLWWRQRRKLH